MTSCCQDKKSTQSCLLNKKTESKHSAELALSGIRPLDSAEHEHEHEHAHPEHACCGHSASIQAQQIVRTAGGKSGKYQTKFQIMAMDCPTESTLIQKVLAKIEGITALEFNYIERVMVMEHDLDDISPVIKAISGVGMEARPLTDAQAAALPAERKTGWRQKVLFTLAGLAAAGSEAVAFSSGSDMSIWIALLALLSIACGGIPILKKGWIALKTGTMNIHFLMSVAVIGAIFIGQWPEAAMVLFLFAVAEKLEDMSLTRAGEAVKALMALAPETAWVRNSAEVWQEVAVAEVVIGSTVRVRPGERVPLDGQISRGVSHFNEAPITGESLPVSKEIGATVFAGSINGDGVVEVCTTASASSSVLARIISTVRDAQASKAPTQRFIDQFAKYYTPVVVMAAVLVAILLPVFGLMTLKASVYTALVMLVIACPCALVIATPVTLVSALASAARHGMLVKGGAPLEMAAKIKAVAFDKTGTLTVGEPEVTGILRPVLRTSLQTQSPEQAGLPAASILTEQNILALAAALDADSTHPLARAVLNAASAQQVPVMQAQNIQELTGLGVQGSVDGQRYLLGSRRLAERTGVLTADIDAQLSEQEAQGQGLLLLMSEQAVLGIITVADKIRDEAQAVIQRLNSMGIHTVMLSGDHQSVATAVGNKIGVEQALGGLLPDDKLARIHALQTQYGHVAMIGDGVNDAPALAQADLGIAMGAAGSDTALETAGAALMEDKLEKLPDLFTHARRTANVLKANIVMALVIKAVFFALALFGIATLWMAVFADVGASLLVIANGLRLAKQIESD